MLTYLQQALTLAQRGRGFCSPNPAVGALVVRDHVVVGEGYHQGCGQAHAEIHALEQAGNAAKGADLYVTLVPCHHTGRTPPCTDAIVKAGIARVFYGHGDPGQSVDTHQSVQQLAQAGILCEYLPCDVIKRFYQAYTHWAQHQTPWVTAKLALSLDGKIAGPKGRRESITAEALQTHTHQLRRQSDAILTTSKTVCADDPLLNCRVAGSPIQKPVFVLDRQLKLPMNARLWQSAQSLVLFYDQAVNLPDKLAAYQKQGATCVPVSCANGYLDWCGIMGYIGQQGVHDLWVEAGGTCLNTLMAEQRLARLWLYYGARVLGDDALAGLKQTSDTPWQHADRRWHDVGGEGVCELNWSEPCLPD
jgi:diaminohydroxyphosphoribosylaminopyrimidine deaminase / 5-amino-6-(5-phosphoribosylamino)uracil reductase